MDSKNILFYTGWGGNKWNYTYFLSNALGGSETAVFVRHPVTLIILKTCTLVPQINSTLLIMESSLIYFLKNQK